MICVALPVIFPDHEGFPQLRRRRLVLQVIRPTQFGPDPREVIFETKSKTVSVATITSDDSVTQETANLLRDRLGAKGQIHTIVIAANEPFTFELFEEEGVG